jgi:hypothetical protein
MLGHDDVDTGQAETVHTACYSALLLTAVTKKIKLPYFPNSCCHCNKTKRSRSAYFLYTLSFIWMVIMTWTTVFSLWNMISWFGKVIQQQNSQHILNWKGRCITPTDNICFSYYKGTQVHCSFVIETNSIQFIQQSHYWQSTCNRFSGVMKFPILYGIQMFIMLFTRSHHFRQSQVR